MDAARLFEDNLALIDRIMSSIAARNGMYGDDADEFASWARLRLIDNDYAIVRKYAGRAKLSTYLNTVLHNLFRDYRIHKWGKWRPSAAAKRLGHDAVLLERLVVRDGYEVGAAIRIMRGNAGVERSATELEELLGRLPRRVQRREVGGEVIEGLGHEDGTEARVKDAERTELAEAAEAALAEALAELDPEDRLILQLRFEQGWTLAKVARSLHLEQKPLYRRMNAVMTSLRVGLEHSGVDRQAMERLVGWSRLDFSVVFTNPEESPAVVRLNPGSLESRGDRGH